MPTRLNSYYIRKEVEEKLAYIRVHFLGGLSVAESDDSPQRLTSQRELAKQLGICQAEVSRLLRGECTPHPKTLERIYQVYFQARCLNWGAPSFFPICALAERDNLHAYRCDLPGTMMKLLHATLNEEPLRPPQQKRPLDSIRVDLHMRAVQLPKGIGAYSFGNDLRDPDVFVVLVSNKFDYNEQYRKAWDEVQAHVVRSPNAAPNIVPISRPVLSHYIPGSTQS